MLYTYKHINLYIKKQLDIYTEVVITLTKVFAMSISVTDNFSTLNWPLQKLILPDKLYTFTILKPVS